MDKGQATLPFLDRKYRCFPMEPPLAQTVFRQRTPPPRRWRVSRLANQVFQGLSDFIKFVVPSNIFGFLDAEVFVLQYSLCPPLCDGKLVDVVHDLDTLLNSVAPNFPAAGIAFRPERRVPRDDIVSTPNNTRVHVAPGEGGLRWPYHPTYRSSSRAEACSP